MPGDAVLWCAGYFAVLSLAAALSPLAIPEIETINMTARLQQARHRHERIIRIKKAILDGLGLDSAPKINVSAIQNADAKRMLERFYRISGSDGVPEVVVEGDGMDEHIFETILLLAEQEPSRDYNIVPFPLRMSDREGRVTSANLIMLLKHKRGHERAASKRRGRKKEGKDRILLKVYHVRADDAEKVLTKVETTVRHTRWIRLTLPVSTIRRALRDGEPVLRLRVTCKDCGKRVTPVLLRKRAERRKRVRAPRAAAASGRSRPNKKKKAKRARRGPRYSKKWPYLVVGMRANMDTRVLRKRDATECQPSPHACCLQRFYVSFKELGWHDWIISPKNYFANYCSGDCTGPNAVGSVGPHFMAGSHSCLTKATAPADATAAKGVGRRGKDKDLCCRPTSMSALSVLHYDLHGKIVKTDIPNMSVDECGCL